jgi:hypothetical protein
LQSLLNARASTPLGLLGLIAAIVAGVVVLLTALNATRLSLRRNRSADATVLVKASAPSTLEPGACRFVSTNI